MHIQNSPEVVHRIPSSSPPNTVCWCSIAIWCTYSALFPYFPYGVAQKRVHSKHCLLKTEIQVYHSVPTFDFSGKLLAHISVRSVRTP